jgi:hypothetical protein
VSCDLDGMTLLSASIVIVNLRYIYLPMVSHP